MIVRCLGGRRILWGVWWRLTDRDGHGGKGNFAFLQGLGISRVWFFLCNTAIKKKEYY